MKKLLLILIAITSMMASAPKAEAQWVVFDPAAFKQKILDFTEMIGQTGLMTAANTVRTNIDMVTGYIKDINQTISDITGSVQGTINYVNGIRNLVENIPQDAKAYMNNLKNSNTIVANGLNMNGSTNVTWSDLFGSRQKQSMRNAQLAIDRGDNTNTLKSLSSYLNLNILNNTDKLQKTMTKVNDKTMDAETLLDVQKGRAAQDNIKNQETVAYHQAKVANDEATKKAMTTYIKNKSAGDSASAMQAINFSK